MTGGGRAGWVAAVVAAVLVSAGLVAQLRPTPDPPARAAGRPELLRVDIVTRRPHDRSAFTEGLAYAGREQLYESTGRDSDARRTDLRTGRVLAAQPLPAPLFGEGMTRAGGRLVQLTWRDGVGFVRDPTTLRATRRFTVAGEGWGLAYDGRVLWRSDGTDVLRAMDPSTFAVIRELRVRDRGRPVEQLNELEVVDGQLLANVWHSSWIARIDLRTGRVNGWVDAAALGAEVADPDPEAVLNGIAWDVSRRRLWLTGKLWPTLFEVRLTPSPGALPPAGLTG